MLGEVPNDIDIVINTPLEKVQEIFSAGKLIGKRFGLNICKRDGYNFEIFTFYTEGDYQDDRWPKNLETATGMHKDAKRRDFTFNILCYDPVSQ